MAASLDDASTSWGNPHRSVWPVLQWGMTMIVVFVGVCGVVRDSWVGPVLASRTHVQALFGFLLCCLIASRFHRWLKHSPPSRAAEVREFSRRASRVVYLILYLVIGAKPLVGIIRLMPLGAAFGLAPLQENPPGARNLAMVLPGPDCQFVLAYGLAALALIRVLAFLSWRRRAHRGSKCM